MAKLIYLLDGKPVREYVIEKERVTIGRRPTNDVHIDNLAVSGEHASILMVGNDAFLEDLDSTNGTIVNGKFIKKHVLQHQDVIEFGKYHLRFLSDAPPLTQKAQNDGFVDTVVITPKKAQVTPPVDSNDSAQDEQKAAELAEAAAEKPVPKIAETPPPQSSHLLVLEGALAGEKIMLNKALTTLGKPGEQVAVLTKRGQDYFLTHLSGDTRPTVNGALIGVQAYAMKNRDVIEVAGIKMEFRLD